MPRAPRLSPKLLLPNLQCCYLWTLCYYFCNGFSLRLDFFFPISVLVS
jgi:hypothetical protein